MKTTKSRQESGFTLVEVTLAIGITAVALVSLMGMLPRGIKTLERASDKAVMARIHQQILGELQLTSWEKGVLSGVVPIDSFDGTVRLYDDQGIELSGKSNSDEKFRHVYTALIHIPKETESLPESVGRGQYNGAKLPGDSESSQFLKLVIVEITNSQDAKFLADPKNGFADLKYPGAVVSFRTIIANTGKLFD